MLLTGPLGAGKTTLTRGIGEGMNVRGPVTSPTFVLARTHPNLGDGAALIHVDAYRLHDSAEFEDLDLDFTHSAVVVEWGDGLVDPGDNWLHLVISRPEGAEAGGGSDGAGGSDEEDDADGAEPRQLRIEAHGPRWQGLTAQGTTVQGITLDGGAR